MKIKDAIPTPEDQHANIKNFLKKQGAASYQEVADKLDVGPTKAKSILDAMVAGHDNVLLRPDGRYDLDKNIMPGGSSEHNAEDRGDGWTVFGVTTDNHMGNKHSRLDVVNKLYDIFAAEGVKKVYNCGNWIDGEARFNKQELVAWGMDGQIDYFIQNFPHRDGITTEFISGDDHEGWYAQRECINIGRYAEMRARDAGRSDLKYIGHVESDVELRHGNGSAVMRLAHPGGGSSYAFSYTSQKIVESLQGGEKPSILLTGHYHKWDFCYPREVHVVSCGCTEDQTMFMRKKKLAAHVGGVICYLKQDPADGHVVRFRAEWIPFYDRGFYRKDFE